jgi:HTH-type transcriptional regulator/antitoxin HigA
MNIKPIHTEDDYNAAIARVDDLWEAAPGTPESDELEVLAVLIGSYEKNQTPLSMPESDLLEAITHLMEQRGL